MAACVHCSAETRLSSTLIGAPVCNARCASAHGACRGATGELAFVGTDSEVAALARLWPALAQIGEARAVDGGSLMKRSVAHTLASVVKPIGARRPGETDRQYAARLVREARARQAERERQATLSAAAAAAAAATTTLLATTPAPVPHEYFPQELPNDIISLLIPLLNSRTELLSLYKVTGENPRVEQALPPRYYPEHVPNDIISLLMSYLYDYSDLLKLWELSGYNSRVTTELIRRALVPTGEETIILSGAIGRALLTISEPTFRRLNGVILDTMDLRHGYQDERWWVSAFVHSVQDAVRAHDVALRILYARVVLLLQIIFQRKPALHAEYLSSVIGRCPLSCSIYTAMLLIAGRRAGVRPLTTLSWETESSISYLPEELGRPNDDFFPYGTEAMSIVLEDYKDAAMIYFNFFKLDLLVRQVRDGRAILSPQARANLRDILQQRGLDAQGI